MVTHAIDHGVPAMAAATVLGAAGLASLGGRIICGLVADRVGAKRTLLAGLALQAVAVSLYLFTRELASFYALALMFGFAYGGVMPLYAILVREYFGARIMGTAFGAVALVSTLGMALGPWAGGWLYDAFGSYFWLFIGSFGIGLGAVGHRVHVPPAPLASGSRCRRRSWSADSRPEERTAASPDTPLGSDWRIARGRPRPKAATHKGMAAAVAGPRVHAAARWGSVATRRPCASRRSFARSTGGSSPR